MRTHVRVSASERGGRNLIGGEGSGPMGECQVTQVQ